MLVGNCVAEVAQRDQIPRVMGTAPGPLQNVMNLKLGVRIAGPVAADLAPEPIASQNDFADAFPTCHCASHRLIRHGRETVLGCQGSSESGALVRRSLAPDS